MPITLSIQEKKSKNSSAASNKPLLDGGFINPLGENFPFIDVYNDYFNLYLQVSQLFFSVIS